MQLEAINSISESVAKAVVAKYPTARRLIQAYKELTQEEGEKLLTNVTV